MSPFVRLGLVALAILALGGRSPAADLGHCGGRHHGCPGCPPAGEHHHGCPGCVARSAEAADLTQDDRALGSSYDVDSVTTLQGTVKGVTVVSAQRGRLGGTHIALQGEGGVTEVHVGPTWFLEQEGVELSNGDALEVTGSVVDSGDETFLVAREIKKGTKVFRLRDERGFPMWAGGARRRQ
jgi:hypothetical protein